LSANEAGLLISAMAAGVGTGLGEAISVERELREGRLQPVLPEYSMYGGALYAVYPSARRVPAKVRVFIEALNAELNGGRRSVR
jgi:DNA-binding transcriptional LysR family regulator